LFRDEDFYDAGGEPVGNVWIVHPEEDDEEEREEWISRRKATRPARPLGYPFELAPAR
jgi:hypothetical protein